MNTLKAIIFSFTKTDITKIQWVLICYFSLLIMKKLITALISNNVNISKIYFHNRRVKIKNVTPIKFINFTFSQHASNAHDFYLREYRLYNDSSLS